MSAPDSEKDFSGMAATMAPDFIGYQTSALPYAGTYIGPAGMQEWSQKMGSWWSAIDVRDPEIFEKEGSDGVVVLSTVHATVAKTGEKLVLPFAQEVRVDLEKGVMTEMRPFYWDVALVNKALGYEGHDKWAAPLACCHLVTGYVQSVKRHFLVTVEFPHLMSS
jgi:uncharacterized protein